MEIKHIDWKIIHLETVRYRAIRFFSLSSFFMLIVSEFYRKYIALSRCSSRSSHGS